MIISSAHLFAKQITAGEVPQIYWRYDPSGIGYVDSKVSYCVVDTNLYRDCYSQNRGYNSGGATYDLRPAELTEKTYAEYSQEEKQTGFYTDYVRLLDVPTYYTENNELSPYHFNVRYKIAQKVYRSNPYDEINVAMDLMYEQSSIVATKRVSTSIPTTGNWQGHEENVHLYVYAGAGRLWNDKTSMAVLDDNIYVAAVVSAENKDYGWLYINEVLGAINYAYIQSEYGIYVSDKYFKGNNNNPDFPIRT